MRTDTTEFTQYNQASAQEPVFVVEVAFDDAGADVIYLTSHAVDGLAGEVFESVLTDISGTTQKINPDKALSEIGALSFSALDDSLTEKQRTKLNAGLGLRGKRARFYAGFQGLDWSTYTLVQTQIIRSASYKDMVYSWKCSDIQREMRKEVFEVKTTALAKTLEPGDAEVEVYNTSDFQAVKQPPSPSGKTDAPGQKVGYIIVEGDDRKEIIRYTGTTGTKFTGCTRGVLGTRPVRVEKSVDEGADNAPKVEEYVYLEMPAPMLAYAILTGSIYGEPGETLPDHWHLGIKPQYIRTADYAGIGDDLWDLSNPDNGLPARLAGVKDEDGKQFVEEELFLLLGCYAPIYSNGEIGLRRMTGVLSGASSTRTLDSGNITGYGSLEHDMGAIINRIVISWNWVDQREAYTRTNLLIDQFSIDTHGDADLKQLEFRALHGSRHSYNTLRSRFDALRDRYAGPPLRLSLDLMPDQNDLEVGDIVRVQLDEIEDYTGETVGIDRAFEVQQAKVNWKTGAVSVELFGSSQKAEPLPPAQEGAALPNEVYAVPGATEINAANFPGKVSSSGGITSITGDISLVGQDDLRSASAIYYCLEDLTINAGVTVTINKNTQIRVKGFFQINGKIDGRGRGLQGGQGMNFVPLSGVNGYSQKMATVFPPVRGYLGASVPAGGYHRSGTWITQSSLTESFAKDRRLSGLRQAADNLALTVSGSSLSGLPENLCGHPGSGGGPVVLPAMAAYSGHPRNPNTDGGMRQSLYPADNVSSYFEIYFAAGGNGGNSGAGLFIVSSGSEFGASGVVDLSGDAGAYGQSKELTLSGDRRKIVNGGRGGAGAPGCAFWAVVGRASNPPTLNNANAIFSYGENSFKPGTIALGPFDIWSVKYGLPSDYVNGNNFVIAKAGLNLPGAVSKLKEHTQIHILNGEIAPEPDLPEYSEKPASLTVTEALNTPKTPNANISTLEVSVTAPTDSAYSYAIVEYRPQGDEGWTNAGPASPEALITVASDGTTYEIRARSVSTSGLISDDYVLGLIATTKITGAEPSDPDVDQEILIPNVRGLELEEQGNETDFGGRDAKFVWRPTSVGQWLEMGSEGQLGASAGELDLYFRDYQVEVWAGGKLVRTEWLIDPAFVYTYEKNAEDYYRQNTANGAWREFEVRVYCRGRLNQVSAKAASLSVQNPAPEVPTQISIKPSLRSIQVSFAPSDDLDYRHTKLWLSDTSGFTPSEDTLVATVDGPVAIQGLLDGTTYHLVMASYDAFGPGSYTPELEVVTQSLEKDDIGGLIDDLQDLENGIGGKSDILFQPSPPTAVYENDHTLWVDTSLNASSEPINVPKKWDGSQWVAVSDQTIKDAAADAAQSAQDAYDAAQSAQDTANGKINSLYQPDEPTEGMSEGDLWFDTNDGNRAYRYDGTAWLDARDSGIASALQGASDAQATADGKVTTFFQAAEPTADGIGDLWVDTNDDNRLHRWDGSAWVDIHDKSIDAALQAAADAFAEANGKSVLLVQSAAPGAEHQNDKTLWIDTTNGANRPKHWNGTQWESIQDADIAGAKDDITDIQAKRTIKLDANGNVSGVEKIDGTDAGQFNILSANFNIVDSSNPSGPPLVPFSVTGNDVYANNLMITHTNMADGSVDLSSPAVTGQVSGDKIEDGAIVNVTETTAAPGTQIFDGTDEGVWKKAASIDVFVLGDGSAIAVQMNFAFSLDMISVSAQQVGPGGPNVRMRLKRGNVIVWQPEPIMASGSGYISLQFGSKIDTSALSGWQKYTVEIMWERGFYDAGSLAANILYNSVGKAFVKDQTVTFEGAFPSTYMGSFWHIYAPALYSPDLLPDDYVAESNIPDGALPLGIGILGPLNISMLNSFNTWELLVLDYNWNAPQLDDPAKADTEELVTGITYYADCPTHKVIGTSISYWIRCVEYRG